MAPGHDRVTMENQGGESGEKSTNWKIETYGPASKFQTFHDEQKGFGKRRHTLRVSTLPTLPAGAEQYPHLSTGQLIQRLQGNPTGNEKAYLRLELSRRAIAATVEVTTKRNPDADDRVLAQFGTEASGHTSIPEGESRTLSVPALDALPVADPLAVTILEAGTEQVIGTIQWPAPYEAKGPETLSKGGAVYKVRLHM
jgi:hypothetical protein